MSEKKDPLVIAKEELGTMDITLAQKTIRRLIKESGLKQAKICECINRTRATLHLALTTEDYPQILVAVLQCLGYEAEKKVLIETKIKTPKGEGQ